MKVFKFGGAAVNSVERIKNVADIVDSYNKDALLLVISAIGKTTNALEKVTKAYFNNNKDEALQLFEQVKKQHVTTAKYLLVTQYIPCESQLKDFFTEVEWLLHDKPVREFDYYYDQIVSMGELLSTCIVSHYLTEKNIQNQWIDVRDIIRTDDNFRDANIDWGFTLEKVKLTIIPSIEPGKPLITQGFIGATDENESATLGREGSDYTAAVFANMINAENVTIWKDVESVMNADPKEVADVQPIASLSYAEVIEMAYYGAQIIHPKTIKPLQNKNIPLFVKCFLQPGLPGTIIHNTISKNLPPIIVIKRNQIMMELRTKDFSFVEDHHAMVLYRLFEKLSISPNITQNGAISLIMIFDNREDKINSLASEAATLFDVQLIPGLALTTIRHYTDASINYFSKGKEKILHQQTKHTFRLVHKD